MDDFDGSQGLSVASSPKIEQFSHDSIRDKLSWVGVNRFLSRAKVHLNVHPEILEQENFLQLRSHVEAIRYLKSKSKLNRARKSFGGELEAMTMSELHEFAIGKQIDVAEAVRLSDDPSKVTFEF